MSDPLGLIRSSGSHGLGGAFQARTGATPEGPSSGPAQPSFKNVLLENIQQVNELQREATTAIEDLQTGRRADVEGVITATQKADAAFHMLVALRNKLSTAFEEVKQMRT
ncbi:MAG: flagellar hook-basal body complex protein FliE [Phycisphaerales bacterium]|nr:flagellar hook-basal body complex protein FliE [Phycisphaerales bacterium]